jgi:hypothetical protein
MPSVTSFGVIARVAFVVVVLLVARPDLVWALGCNVGVNVNSFQNFSAAERDHRPAIGDFRRPLRANVVAAGRQEYPPCERITG